MNSFIPTPQIPLPLVLAAAAACAVLASGVRAADVPQVHVNYADLDLNSSAGASVLYHRIRAAADRVCTTPGVRDLAEVARKEACMNRAVAEAVVSADSPRLTRLFEVKTGKTPAMQLASSK
jgi:UrcA family protein